MDTAPLNDPNAPVFLRRNATRIMLFLLMAFLLVPLTILVWSSGESLYTASENQVVPTSATPLGDLASREQAFNAAPTVAEAIALSNAFASAASYAGCERVARKGLKSDSLNSILLNNLGFAQIELRQLGEARKNLQKAVAIKPSFTLAQNNLKWCLDEIDKAFAALLEKEKKGDINDPAYQMSMGLSWFELGEYEKSNECYRKAIKLSPSDPRPHNNLGLNLMFAGQTQDAIQCFRKASELNQTEQLYKNNLNWALKEAGQP